MSDEQTALRDAYTRFAALVESIRPSLHRYCSRMTGSVLDGEDLVQETLAQGYYGLSLLRQDVPLKPWLFRIAHHKCVDFLRGRRPAVELDERDEPIVEIDGELENRQLAGSAFSSLVLALPPKERATIVLKDLLDHSLPEIAQILETSLGSVKSALHRAREKLAAWRDTPPARPAPPSAAERGYIDAFNRRDWAALRTLWEEEVSCELVGFVHLAGREALESNYLTNYAKLSYEWKMVAGEVDGEPVILCMQKKHGQWTPHHAIRLSWRGPRVARIRDYAHISYLFTDAIVRSP